MTAAYNRSHSRAVSGVDARVLNASNRAEYFNGWSHFNITHQNEVGSDTFDSYDIFSKLPQSDSLDIFLVTHTRERIKLSVHLQSTFLEIRKQIYDILRIPLDQWQLFSCGGRLFWDSRTLADYDMKD